jgi:hypothetical protein
VKKPTTMPFVFRKCIPAFLSACPAAMASAIVAGVISVTIWAPAGAAERAATTTTAIRFLRITHLAWGGATGTVLRGGHTRKSQTDPRASPPRISGPGRQRSRPEPPRSGAGPAPGPAGGSASALRAYKRAPVSGLRRVLRSTMISGVRTHKVTTVDGKTVVVLEPENDEDAAALEADERVDNAVTFADHRLRPSLEECSAEGPPLPDRRFSPPELQ